jgi:hypothetical protein
MPPLPQFALPAVTLIVSPFEALLIQVATLDRSGVLVQVGLDPVQAAAVTFEGVWTSDPDDPPLPQLDKSGVHKTMSNNGKRRLMLFRLTPPSPNRLVRHKP